MSRPTTHVYIAATLDGFIARADDAIDWLDHDAGSDDYGWAAFRGQLDSIVIGRRSFEKVLGFGVDWPYAGLATTVWSRSFTTADVPADLSEHDVSVSALGPRELLDQLGDRGLQSTWIDGGLTLQSFLAAGLIDHLTVTRMPILIGTGIPLFGAVPADVRLTHVETVAFASGVVQSRYAVNPPSTPAS